MRTSASLRPVFHHVREQLFHGEVDRRQQRRIDALPRERSAVKPKIAASASKLRANIRRAARGGLRSLALDQHGRHVVLLRRTRANASTAAEQDRREFGRRLVAMARDDLLDALLAELLAVGVVIFVDAVGEQDQDVARHMSTSRAGRSVDSGIAPSGKLVGL